MPDKYDCTRCEGGKAAIYCPDCNTVLCLPCSGRAHHPRTLGELHSVEEISEEESSSQGVRLVSPVVDELLVALLIYVMVRNVRVEEDYLRSGNHCPTISGLQELVAAWDDGLFYVVKGVFTSYCFTEDSFWRLFLDAWVRGIVTETDSWFLLLAVLPSAFVFQGLLLLVMVPLIAGAHAFLVWIFSEVERRLPRIPQLVLVEAVVRKVDITGALGLSGDDDDPPPWTFKRQRPALSFKDAQRYFWGRQLRTITFYYNSTAAVLGRLLLTAMALAAALRGFCILLPATAPKVLRWVAAYLLGLNQTITTQQTWFGAPRHGGFSADGFLSPAFDQLLGQVVHSAVEILPGGLAALAQFGLALARPVVAAALLFGLPLHFMNARRRKRRGAVKDPWVESGERDRLLGACPGGAECGCLCARAGGIGGGRAAETPAEEEEEEDGSSATGEKKGSTSGGASSRGRSRSPAPVGKVD